MADPNADYASSTYDADEYPEGHSPFCWKDCDHPCHDAYDEAVAAQNDGSRAAGGRS